MCAYADFLFYFRGKEAADDVTLDIHRKALFCWFGREISFWLKIREGRNTPCIAGFPNCTAGAKDPTKAQRGSFSAVANYIRGSHNDKKVEQLYDMRIIIYAIYVQLLQLVLKDMN